MIMAREPLRWFILRVLPALILFSYSDVFGTATILVPGHQPTIQAGIDAAQNGDTILVAQGTYFEQIDFRGKSITVVSQSGRDKTIIDGERAGSVVTFCNGEGNACILRGFTITNGLPLSTLPFGGGISIRNASPMVTECTITKNGAQNGGGLFIKGNNSSPTIENNVIAMNIGTEMGGGIEIRDASSPVIKNNLITENLAMNGSGIFISNGATPLIEGNTIQKNDSGCDMHWPDHAQQYLNGVDITDNLGCGDWFPSTIFVADESLPVLRNNEVSENIGGGVSILLHSSPTLEGNTIAGNRGGHPIIGGILVAMDSSPIFAGNAIENNQTGAVWIDDTSSFFDKAHEPLFLGGFHVIEDSDETFIYSGQWDLGLGGIYSGGTRRASGETGATASVKFKGTGVSLIYFADPGGGIANISIDGVPYSSIDTYAKTTREGGRTEQVITTNLPLSEHLLRITVSGNRNSMSSGYGIVVDAVAVLPGTSVADNRIIGSVHNHNWGLSLPQHERKMSNRVLLVPSEHATIQKAIESAQNGDTIIVSPGEYRENLNFLGKDIVVRSQNPADLTTVQNTLIDAQKNWPTIVFISGEGREAKLEGFTIQNGFGHKAVQICSSSPTISNNIIKDSPGGAIFCAYSDSPLIMSNVIENNGADSNISICCSLCSAEIRNNQIKGNTGSGISSYFSKPLIVDNTITQNTAKGGTDSGIYLDHVSPAIVRGNDIAENKTIINNVGGDGVVLDFFCNAVIEGNLLTDNDGGGIFMIDDCSPLIRNNVITGNGGGLSLSLSRPELINNTIADNENVGIYLSDIASVVVTNTILWNGFAEIYLSDYAEATVKYSLVEEGWAGDGNIQQNPLFVGGGDYHLTANSPCINAGDSNLADLPETDKDGQLRVMDGIVDIGAYEYPGSAPPVAEFSGHPVIGRAPLGVQFTDLSIGTITSWSWDFGDGNTGTEQHPIHTYETADIYTVSLTVNGPLGSDTKTKTDYITVVLAPPVLDIKANGLDGPVTVSSNALVSITVSLNPGEKEACKADWWIAVNTPFGAPGDWFSYAFPTGWLPGIHLCTQAPLFEVSQPFQILNIPLPAGNFTFYFALDDPDGQATGSWWGLDSVEVTVED